jgi:GNAT superfamily N-acetyltransferase
MYAEAPFDLIIPGYYIRRLGLEDAALVQTLFERCRDHMDLVYGRDAAPGMAEEELRSLPAGKQAADKFIFGIFDHENMLVGLLDTLRGYPEAESWFIDHLLMAPGTRSQGLGHEIVQRFAEFARANGAATLVLGVVRENARAFQFWKHTGFQFVCETEPQQFGNKIQTVSIMRRTLLRP